MRDNLLHPLYSLLVIGSLLLPETNADEITVTFDIGKRLRLISFFGQKS